MDVLQPEAVRWLLDCRHQQRHPFTGAEPGGWGWTDLSGAVPDADDTPAAMLALAQVRRSSLSNPALDQQIEAACRAGANWLLGLQNRDGGWPTFCRGWGKLPFDRSGSDLTAHALRALHIWKGQMNGSKLGNGRRDAKEPTSRLAARQEKAIERGLAYLGRTQRADGSWLPLWFGNHDNRDDENPIYGTARVLLAYETLGRKDQPAYKNGCDYLIKAQNADGGWGGGDSVTRWLRQNGLPCVRERGGESIVSTVEESAVALEALAGSGIAGYRATIIEGVRFLQDAIATDRCDHPWPIGFYFAKLWYHEQLYPLILTTAALGKAMAALKQP
ncbi:MAG: prenyltransferase/squalene oxidase repeat-containing protein [Pirellulaceae bacterium]